MSTHPVISTGLRVRRARVDTSFEDSIRQAASLPTASEIAAKKATEERAAKAFTDDQPRRHALRLRFEADAAPLIDQVFQRAATALDGSDVRLVVSHVFPSDLLADKAYAIELTAPRDSGRPKTLVSPLHFSFNADGQVTAAAPDVSSAPPTLRVGTSAVKKPMGEFTQELISSIFTDYVKAATRALRSAGA
jgi:hypothetical protein